MKQIPSLSRANKKRREGRTEAAATEPARAVPVRMGAVAAGTALALGLALCLTPALAQAQTIEELQNEAIAANQAFEDAQAKAGEIQDEIQKNEEKVAGLESSLPSRKAKAAAAVKASYKLQQIKGDLLMLLLSAEDFNQLVTQAAYLDVVSDANADAVSDLNQTIAELRDTQASLSAQKAEADQRTAAAQEKKVQAEAARDAAIAAATANAAAAEAAYAAGTATDGTAAAIGALSSAAPSGDFEYVDASMYGEGDGFMYGTTASGDTVTPTSMGVAMRTMPLGTVIEITYGGNTVRAVVNDRGPFVGNRQIDLQPAVAHALGFDGVGTLGFRVVG